MFFVTVCGPDPQTTGCTLVSRALFQRDLQLGWLGLKGGWVIAPAESVLSGFSALCLGLRNASYKDLELNSIC